MCVCVATGFIELLRGEINNIYTNDQWLMTTEGHSHRSRLGTSLSSIINGNLHYSAFGPDASAPLHHVAYTKTPRP